jgi:hypothetical protein
MLMLAGPANLDPRPWLERRAQRIADPAARLRYLRQGMARTPRRGAATLAWMPAWLIVPLIFALLPTRISPSMEPTRARLLLSGRTQPATLDPSVPNVWRVDSLDSAETYSNGLRIDLTYTVANHKRARFDIYSLTGAGAAVGHGDRPVGIVYHTTESHLAPFEEGANRQLKQLGRGLLELVRQEHCYHYAIDRFGRVFRIVQESDAAYHAGFSVWSDSEGVYVNLNDSFLGVSFEGQTGSLEQITAAQIAAGKALTEMLRSRYRIPASNCVTHAQVSVNPDNMLLGAHVDWAGGFPFAGLGLPDNYQAPPASVYLFGFAYDSVFLHATSNASAKGLAAAEEQIRIRADAQGMNAARYRAMLQRRYKNILTVLKERGT